MTVEQHPSLPMGLAVVTVVKGMIGTGILGLPYVSSSVRLAIAGPGLILTAMIGAFSVWRLIQCKSFLWEQCSSSDSDVEDAENTYGLGPLAVVGRRAFGRVGVAVAGFGIIASQLGFSVSYIDVMVATLSEETQLGPWLDPGSIRYILCFMLCALCMLRRLSSLAWLSGAALVIYFYLFLALLYYGGRRIADGEGVPIGEATFPVRWNHFGSFLGTCIFAQEAIVICQYVYDDMHLERPQDFLPVLLSSFGVSGALFTFVGVFGFLAYGDDIKVVFYESFPDGSTAVRLGEVTLCIVLFFSYALQMYPVLTFLESAVLGIRPASEAEMERIASNKDRSGKNSDSDSDVSDDEGAIRSVTDMGMVALLRSAAVFLTCLLAAWIPNLACLTGYSGSFAVSAIGFFMPPLCHWKLCPGTPTLVEHLGNIVLLLAGVAAVWFGISATSC